jgi:hypothetical protein
MALASDARATEFFDVRSHDGQDVLDEVYGWTGFHVGVQGGYGWDLAHSADLGGFVGAIQPGLIRNMLAYGTGGFSFATISKAGSHDDQWQGGWVLGIGAEAQLARDWSARIQALRYDLGRRDLLLSAGTPR